MENTNKIETRAMELLGEEYTVSYKSMTKTNGVVKSGFEVSREGALVAPIVYPEDGMSVDEAAKFIADVAKKTEEEMPVYLSDDKHIADLIRDKIEEGSDLQLCVVSAEANKELEDKLITRKFQDLLAYIRVRLSDEASSDEASCPITKGYAKMYGLDEDEVFETALRNVEEQASIIDMFELLRSMSPFPVPEPEDGEPKMFVVTNKAKLHGASAIMSNEVLGRAADQIGASELIVIPSSIHELIVVSAEGLGELAGGVEGMIQDVNTSQLLPEEILANHPYYFNRDTGLRMSA